MSNTEVRMIPEERKTMQGQVKTVKEDGAAWGYHTVPSSSEVVLKSRAKRTP